jgi:hypothetical protein
MVSDWAFIFHMYISCDKTFLFDHVTLTLKFDLLFKNFYVSNIFWMVKPLSHRPWFHYALQDLQDLHTCSRIVVIWLKRNIHDSIMTIARQIIVNIL